MKFFNDERAFGNGGGFYAGQWIECEVTRLFGIFSGMGGRRWKPIERSLLPSPTNLQASTLGFYSKSPEAHHFKEISYNESLSSTPQRDVDHEEES